MPPAGAPLPPAPGIFPPWSAPAPTPRDPFPRSPAQELVTADTVYPAPIEEFEDEQDWDEEDELQRLHGMVELAEDFEDEWRLGDDGADRCLEVYDGEQWTAEDREDLENRKQPAIKLDEIGPAIDFILGIQDSQPLEWDPKPESESDDAVADAARAGLKTVATANLAEHQWVEARRWALTYGFGPIWTGFYIRNPDPREEPCQFEAADPRETLLDPTSRKLDMSDMRYIVRRRELPIAAVMEAYPDKADDIAAAAESEDEKSGAGLGKAGHPDVIDEGGMIPPPSSWEHVPWNRAYRHGQHRPDTEDDRPVMVYELWERYRGAGLLFHMDGGYRLLVSHDNSELIQQLLLRGDMVAFEHSDDLPLVRYWVFTGDVLLAHGPSPYAHGDLPCKIVWHRRNRLGHPISLVKSMIDPQSEINWRRSRMVWQMLSTALRIDPLVLERMGISREEAEANAALPNAVWLAKQGEIEPLVNNSNLSSQFELMQDARGVIRSLASMWDEMIGAPTSTRTGAGKKIAIEQAHLPLRPQERNMRLAHKLVGEQMWSLIQQAHTAKWLVRVTDDVGAGRFLQINQPLVNPKTGQVEILNDIRQARMSFYIDEGAYHPTMRQRTSEMLAGLAQSVPDPLMRQRIIATALATGEVPKVPAITSLIQALLNPQQKGKPPARPPSVSIRFPDLPPDTQQVALQRADLPPSQYLPQPGPPPGPPVGAGGPGIPAGPPPLPAVLPPPPVLPGGAPFNGPAQ